MPQTITCRYIFRHILKKHSKNRNISHTSVFKCRIQSTAPMSWAVPKSHFDKSKYQTKSFPRIAFLLQQMSWRQKTPYFSDFTQAPDTLLVVKHIAKFINPTHISRIPIGTESRHDKIQIAHRYEPGHAMIRYAS